LERLTKEFGLRQKQIFDIFISKDGVNDVVLNMASTLNDSQLQRQVRKSFVVTKKNLKLLNEASEKTGLQRDTIIDIAFKFIIAMLQKETEQQKEQYQKALLTLNESLNCLLTTEKELQNNLDEEDAVITRVSIVITVLNNLIHVIEENIKKGTPIDPEGM
jgi:hypothetical protein